MPRKGRHMPTERLRIGIILPEFPSYTETFIVSQVKGLCERGYRVIMFCASVNATRVAEVASAMGNWGHLEIRQLGAVHLAGNALKALLLRPSAFFTPWRNAGNDLRKAIHMHLCAITFRYAACDIYHFGYSGTAIAYLPILPLLNGKKFVSCQGTAEHVKPLTEPGRIKKLYTVFGQADRIHCVSAEMRNHVMHYGAAPERIFVNRPAVDTVFFSRQIPKQEARHIVILSVGRLIFQKGMITGVLALREVANQYPDVEWVIAGDGPDQEELAYAIHQMGLIRQVQLAGRKSRDEMVALYSAADIYLLPSVSEGIANVVLEAMSMELPVVSTDAGGMCEVIQHGENGLICPIDDYRGMAAQLLTLINDPSLRKRLGTAARKTILEGFHINRYIDVFEQEYLQSVNNKRS